MNHFYHEVSPEDRYKAFIQKFWVLDNQLNPLHTPASYVLPNGCCTIAFIRGNGADLNIESRQVHLPQGIYLSGQITKRASLSLRPFSKAIMAQVKPWLPSAIGRIPMYELVNNAVSLEFINSDMYKRLHNIDLSDEKNTIAGLYKALDPYLQVDSDGFFVKWLFGKLQSCSANQLTIAQVADASGYSQRRIEQKLKNLIGLTAKEIKIILQVRQLIDDLSKPDYNKNLGELAHRYGYYDQSHFIKSYQRIMLEKPSKFQADQHILPTTGHFDYLQF